MSASNNINDVKLIPKNVLKETSSSSSSSAVNISENDDCKPELIKYGFARKFSGDIYIDSSSACRLAAPNRTSPLQRSINCEIDEMKDFSREQYILNFMELQIPEGHDNPMAFSIKYDDSKLTKDEECLLHNLTCKSKKLYLPESFSQNEIDCGLLSILLAICYDVRSTLNEPTCESGWTRSILTATLCYFEQFDSIRAVVISFLRRSLIYPLHRNFDFSVMCVQDAFNALQKSPAWILKQFLVTHGLFLNDETSYKNFNQYFIEDYVRYIYNESNFAVEHMQMLAQNLKNILFDVFKKDLRLNLNEIEAELLKELITDMNLENSTSDETDEDDNEYTDSDDIYATDESSDSEMEEISVIEQGVDTLKL